MCCFFQCKKNEKPKYFFCEIFIGLCRNRNKIMYCDNACSFLIKKRECKCLACTVNKFFFLLILLFRKYYWNSFNYCLKILPEEKSYPQKPLRYPFSLF